MRSKASYSESPLHNLNSYTANILRAYVKDKTNNAKKSTKFCSYSKNVLIEDDMLDIIKDFVSNDDQFTRKTAMPQYKFLDLVNLVLTTTC